MITARVIMVAQCVDGMFVLSHNPDHKPSYFIIEFSELNSGVRTWWHIAAGETNSELVIETADELVFESLPGLSVILTPYQRTMMNEAITEWVKQF